MRHALDVIYLDDDFTWRKRVCYDQLCEVLWEVFEPGSFLDLGSAQGYTLDWFHGRGVAVRGVEGASAAFKFMTPLAKKRTRKHDLRDPLRLGRKFDLVCCMEVAEHVEPEFEGVLLGTVRRHMGRWLAFSAAKTYDDHAVGTERQSHWNVRPYGYWEDRLEALGLALRRDLRDKTRALLKSKRKAYYWWRQNLIVCETT